MKDIIGFYQTRNQAERVKDELLAAGFNRNDITIYDRGSKAEASFWEEIKDAFGFASEDDRHLYAEAARRGAVAVGLSYERDDDPRVATEIMSRGALDLDQQSVQWRQEGWTGRSEKLGERPVAATMPPPMPAAAVTTGRQKEQKKEVVPTALQQEAQTGKQEFLAGKQQEFQTGKRETVAGRQREVIPIIEEEITVGKREVAAGGVRIHAKVIERPVHQEVQLREEHVDIERHRVDRPVTEADQAFRDRDIEMTARSEEAVISKKARVVEEVVISKDVAQRTQAVDDKVRRIDVDVEKIGDGAGQFAPEMFAKELATDARFRGGEWKTVEPEARKNFELRYPGQAWEQVKEAIHQGYDKMRSV